MRPIQQDLLSTLLGLHPPPQAMLDVGCGNGYFTHIMASALPHTHISAVDPKLSEHTMNKRNIDYFQSSVETLPFVSSSFDVVVACMSFHHWGSKQSGIREAFRVLKPSGFLILGDPFFEGIMRNRFAAWLLQKTDKGKFTSFEEIESYLDAVGLKLMSVLPVSSSFGTMFIVLAQKPG